LLINWPLYVTVVANGCRFTRKLQPLLDAFQFIKDVAIDWTVSEYLEAEPGQYITVARKQKEQTTGLWECKRRNSRTSNIKFDFLEKGKNMRQLFMLMLRMLTNHKHTRFAK
jgi:hypothetical protein